MLRNLFLLPFAMLLPFHHQTSMSNEDVVSSRASQTAQYGRIFYHADFTTSGWTTKTIDACPSFGRYVFAIVANTSNSTPSRYLFVYDIGTSPTRSRSKPWEDGMFGVPLDSKWGSATGTRQDEANIAGAFNRVLRDGQKNFDARNLVSRPDFASCFAAVAGEELATPEPATGVDTQEAAPVIGAIFEVKSADPFKRFQVLRFDKTGQITDAHVTDGPEKRDE